MHILVPLLAESLTKQATFTKRGVVGPVCTSGWVYINNSCLHTDPVLGLEHAECSFNVPNFTT